jgi:transcription initiation factor TFIID subunit 4
MSKAPDDQLRATEQEGSVHPSQQAGQQHVNTPDQISKTELTEGSKNDIQKLNCNRLKQIASS